MPDDLWRGRIRSMKKVVEMTREYLDEVNARPGEYNFCIGYGYDYKEAVKFREMLKDNTFRGLLNFIFYHARPDHIPVLLRREK